MFTEKRPTEVNILFVELPNTEYLSNIQQQKVNFSLLYMRVFFPA